MLLMLGVYMTCMEICKSGVGIGMSQIIIQSVHHQIRRARRYLALTVWGAAGRGVIVLPLSRACVRPIGTTPPSTAGAAVLVFVWYIAEFFYPFIHKSAKKLLTLNYYDVNLYFVGMKNITK